MHSVNLRFAFLALFFPLLFACSGAAETKWNVLFIASDDLRPQLGCYGFENMKTPCLDDLASRGMVFERAYCQAAVCRASRLSLLTGRRPDTTKISTNGGPLFRSHSPNWITLPQQFKKHGYQSHSIGKIFHGAFRVRDAWNDPESWSVPEWHPGPRYYYTPQGVSAARQVFLKRAGRKLPAEEWVNHFVLGPSWEAPAVPDSVLYDGQVADEAIKRLGELQNKPFFLAVGFLKPHLPFVAPKKYWDLYSPDEVPPAKNLHRPQDAPAASITSWGHPRSYTDFPRKGNPSPDLVAKLTHGYAACVSYVDAQTGRVLAELDRLGLREKTIVVFWGDHGYHLGENGIWGKATNFELTTRVPLIVSIPGMKNAGKGAAALVELVDLYPSLCEWCGIPLPDGLEGTSLAPLLRDPNRPWKKAAFSQHPSSDRKFMGRSVRSDKWRFTRWKGKGKNGKLGGVELYDLENDPAGNVNLAGQDEYEAQVEAMSRLLDSGWRNALPVQ